MLNISAFVSYDHMRSLDEVNGYDPELNLLVS